MSIQEATDTELRNLIFEKPKVIVKFTKTNCPICERMGKAYFRLSEDPRYQDILFLVMDASENPVSSQEVHLTGTPFFATYQNGVLATCKLIADESELEAMLNNI